MERYLWADDDWFYSLVGQEAFRKLNNYLEERDREWTAEPRMFSKIVPSIREEEDSQ